MGTVVAQNGFFFEMIALIGQHQAYHRQTCYKTVNIRCYKLKRFAQNSVRTCRAAINSVSNSIGNDTSPSPAHLFRAIYNAYITSISMQYDVSWLLLPIHQSPQLVGLYLLRRPSGQ